MSMPGLRSQTEISLRRLRAWVLLLFFLFSIPMAALFFILLRSAKKEEILIQKSEANKAFRRIQDRAQTLFSKENQRKFEDYSFFNVSQNTLLKQQAGLSFSSLSDPSSEGGFPGIIGYFQYNPDGSFQIPLLPEIEKMPQEEASRLLGEDEYKKRMELRETLRRKSEPLFHLVQGVSEAIDEQGSTQQLVNIPSQELLPYVKRQTFPQAQRQVANSLNTLNLENDQVRSFESRISALEFFPLVSGDLSFIRRASLQGKTYLQGFAITKAEFLRSLIEAPFFESDLKRSLKLEVGGKAEINAEYTSKSSAFPQLPEVIVFEQKLAPPLDGITLTFRASSTGLGPSGSFLVVLGSSLGVVFGLTIFVFYRLTRGQIALAQERGNFVSAVSHELKTPLTSIRMYAEMLSSGMVNDQAKSNEYYRFILSEAERLSRLVNNVLQLAQIESRDELLPLRTVAAHSLFEQAVTKIRPLLAENGFSLQTTIPSGEIGPLLVNEDAFLQIILNFAENSVKFCKQAEQKEIVFGVRPVSGGAEYFIRDFGPGVPKSELNKIFQLFYRGENELTRSTKGTGLGLGLSFVLANRMRGNALARSMNPGLECVLLLRISDLKLDQSGRSIQDSI